ncbi:MAG: hypothetical protein EXR64_01105 [Dehalococcoidia bacterium]|nr:hypothetical protein [Dehalococcoidia bacterium]
MTVLHPVPIRSLLPATRGERIRDAVVRRALPIIAGSAAALVATLAAERAVREIAMSAAGHLGGPANHRGSEALIRTVVTEVTVVERIRRRA